MSFLKSFKKGIKNFNYSIQIIINFILLSMVYLIGVGLTSIIAKLSKKHFLTFKKEEKTYWSDLNLKKKQMGEYFRQF